MNSLEVYLWGLGNHDLCQSCLCAIDWTLGLERGYCRVCYSEFRKVKSQNARARHKGLKDSLTLAEWLDTLSYFGWKCAYCISNDYEVLEHNIPISRGGGTTFNNCVPACQNCNIKKSHDDDIPGSDRVRGYLNIFAYSLATAEI